MAFVVVHFTVGFVSTLTVLLFSPLTRYRLTGAYIGGIWALGPDIHHLLDGALGEQIYAHHDSDLAELFFFHSTLDSELFRAHTHELTFGSLAVLGTAFVVYEWRVNVTHPVTQTRSTPDISDD